MLTGPPDAACYQLYLWSKNRNRRQVQRESCHRGKIEDAGHIKLYVCASVCLRAHVVVYVRGCVVGADVGLRCFFFQLPSPCF